MKFRFIDFINSQCTSDRGELKHGQINLNLTKISVNNERSRFYNEKC